MRSLVPVILALIAMAAVPAPAAAQPDGVRIERPWARASTGTSRPAAAYLTIVNDGGQAVRLVGAASPVAEHAQAHRTMKEGGVMKMMSADAIEVPAGGQVVFEPGGLHVMLMGLKQPLKQGETFPLTLRFADGEAATVTVPVLGPGAMGPEDGE